MARRQGPPPTASPSRRRMPEPNTSDRNSHGSRVPEISNRKIAADGGRKLARLRRGFARFSGRLPATRCGEEDRRLLRFSNWFRFLRSRSITHADRAQPIKLARDDEPDYLKKKLCREVRDANRTHVCIISGISHDGLSACRWVPHSRRSPRAGFRWTGRIPSRNAGWTGLRFNFWVAQG